MKIEGLDSKAFSGLSFDKGSFNPTSACQVPVFTSSHGSSHTNYCEVKVEEMLLIGVSKSCPDECLLD